MAGTLEAVDAEEVDAELNSTEGVSDTCALVQDHTRWVGLFEHLDDWAWGVSGCLDDSDALVEDGLGVAWVVGWVHRWEESQVHAEWVAGHLLALSDLFAEVIWCWLCEGCDDTETTGIGDC